MRHDTTHEELLERGFALLPVHATGRWSKRPHVQALQATRGTSKWSGLRDTPAAADEVAEWLARPNVGLAVITGAASGNLAVIDQDVRSSITAPETLTSRTQSGHGRHLFYRIDRELGSSKLTIGDLKAGGGYAVVPPTTGYEFLNAAPVARLAADDLEQLLLPYRLAAASSPTRPLPTTYGLPRGMGHAAGWQDKYPWYGYAGDPDLVLRAMEIMGIPLDRLDRPFLCPFHPERNPSAVLYFDALTQTYKIHDFHYPNTPAEFRTLAEARATRAYGDDKWLRRPEAVRWWLRLWFEVGVIEAHPELVPMQTEHLNGAALKLAEGFRLLCALSWLDHPPDAQAYSKTFAAAWTGVPLNTTKVVLPRLHRSGVIFKVDDYPGRFGNPGNAYLPGGMV